MHQVISHQAGQTMLALLRRPLACLAGRIDEHKGMSAKNFDEQRMQRWQHIEHIMHTCNTHDTCMYIRYAADAGHTARGTCGLAGGPCVAVV